MKRISMFLTGLGLIVAGAAADAQRGRPGAAAMTFVAKAGASDLYEIESSRIALSRAARPDVREMARMLVADHTRSSEQVMAAARADGLRPAPPRLEPRHRAMIRQLQRARGPGFDRLYLSQQVPAHREALTLHRNYSRLGRGDDLRRAAAAIAPVVEGHLAHARRLERGR
jgi:putative membrane protein